MKYFTSDSGWTLHTAELGGRDTFFSLAELKAVRGPLGLPIERDLYWKPKTLRKIAPELF